MRLGACGRLARMDGSNAKRPGGSRVLSGTEVFNPLQRQSGLRACPLSLAESYKEMYPLTVAELPFWLPSIETKMTWHEKNQRDPFHAWLRDKLTASGRSDYPHINWRAG